MTDHKTMNEKWSALPIELRSWGVSYSSEASQAQAVAEQRHDNEVDRLEGEIEDLQQQLIDFVPDAEREIEFALVDLAQGDVAAAQQRLIDIVGNPALAPLTALRAQTWGRGASHPDLFSNGASEAQS